jgi:hypothetical protein
VAGRREEGSRHSGILARNTENLHRAADCIAHVEDDGIPDSKVIHADDPDEGGEGGDVVRRQQEAAREHVQAVNDTQGRANQFDVFVHKKSRIGRDTLRRIDWFVGID